MFQTQCSVDPSEMEYILEYYSLVREGKTNCKQDRNELLNHYP